MNVTGTELAQYHVEDRIAVLAIDHPPVNALSHCVRIAVAEGVARALEDTHADALVLICRGRTFFAGADVKELGRPIEPPKLADIMARFEASTKPVISAMHGTALGGGFELALAGHFRVGVPSLVVGLPEVALGLLPGAGGTQRVPRIVGAEKGLELIGLGRHIRAEEALALGLLDAVVAEDDLQDEAVAFARTAVDQGRPLTRVRDIELECSQADFDILAEGFRERHPQLFVGLKAPAGAIEAVRAAALLPFDEGIARERELASGLTASPESAAQRHLFFAERAAQKIAGATGKVAAPGSMRVTGEWPAAARFRDHLVVDGEALRVVADDVDFATYAARIADAGEAPVVVATRHLDRFAELRVRMRSDAMLVGLNETHGIWEIVLHEEDSPVAAMTVMGLARAEGVPAIFVRPLPGLVIARMQGVFAAAVAALLEEGVENADIAASVQAYGFAFAMTGRASAPGQERDEIAHRIVAECAAEATRMIGEGAVLRGSDIDFAMVRAGLWPLWRGGPAFVAEREGATRIAQWREPRRVTTS